MVYIGDWGERMRQLNPIGKSVSVSFRVRVVRACERGEAAWACSGGMLLYAGDLSGNMCSSCFCSGGVLGPSLFAALRKGFKAFLQ